MTGGLVLTDEQKAIIGHPLAPLRVAAGAGTGKTTTVVLRLRDKIAHGIEPEEALGITFTNKAAEELSDRLRSELPDLARDGREVEVTTYHGFAHSILQEFGAIVGVERDTPVIGPGYQRQLIEDGLGAGRYRHLDLTFPSGRVAEAATLGRQLGDNLRTAGNLRSSAPASDQLGDVWEKRLEIAAILEAYEEAKARVGVVDYSDLVHLAHRLVADHPDVAARIRSRYRIVLLDEYQDTDPAQRLFLLALFGEAFPITAVGDADQTIYEWRGASRRNFEGFPDHFPDAAGSPAATLPLTLNRRSDRMIIELANIIRERIHGADGFDPLRPAPEAGPGSIEVSWLRTAREEADWIADRARELHDEERAWRDIAVLFRKNKSIGPVRDALLAARIPVDVVSLGGLLTVPEITDLHAWLRILQDPEDSAALARILLGGKYRLGLSDLAPLRRWVRAHDRDRAAAADDEQPGWPLLEAIDALDQVEGLSAEATDRLGRFRALYRRLLVEAQGVSLVELCRSILHGIEAWTEIDSLEDHAALSARLNLYRFLDLAEGWSPLEGRASLQGFLGYLTILEDENAAEELDTATVSQEDAVSLLTVHRAKGLEWDVVFLPALAAGTFPAGSQGYDNPVDYPRYLPYELRVDADALPDLTGAGGLKERKAILADQHQDQEWRIAYVATTRARHLLVMSGAFWTGGKRPTKRSEFFDLAFDLEGSVKESIVMDPGLPPELFAPSDHAAPPDPLFDGGWPEALRGASAPDWLDAFPVHADAARDKASQLRLELEALPEPPEAAGPGTFTTSVTGLVTMARCPQQFRWSTVDRLPRRPSAGRLRGITFHRRVELRNLGKVPLEEVDDTAYDLPRAGEGTGGGSPIDPFTVFAATRFADLRPRFVEVPIDLRVGASRVRGRIDAVYEPEPGVWEIVDYKSGRRHDDPATAVQLQAYAVAAVEGAIATDRPEHLTVSFAYFGGGELEETIEVVDDTWLDNARERLEDLTTRAAAGDFVPTPSTACASCDFLTFCTEGQRFIAGSP
jgi:DNA helicase-2/ATP-dependent DNA helicase PcrA